LWRDKLAPIAKLDEVLAQAGPAPSAGPVQEEFMKPAIEVDARVSSDPYQKVVRCLRCEQQLERYQLMKVHLIPGSGSHGLAILTCAKCGHVEFVAESSPLLNALELVSVDTGDGD
jgi:RNase P subunit RPR2